MSSDTICHAANLLLTFLSYHESVNNWEFGKLSALQEIALAVEAGYRYYYMGM